MMQKKILPLFLFVPLAFVVGSNSPTSQTQPGLDLSKMIGVVDVESAVAAFPLWLKGNEELRARAADANLWVEKARNELNILSEKRKAYEAGSAQSVEAELRFRGARAELQEAEEVFNVMLAGEQLKLREKVYLELNREIDALAKERNLQLILRTKSVLQVGDANLRERNERYDSSYVLFHQAALDLTPELIKILKSR